MASFTLDLPAIERGCETALANLAPGQDAAFKATIADTIYSWPGETLRSTGERAGRTRNIIDSGAFRDSQSYQQRGLRLTWLWSVDYAAIILFGYTTSGGGSYPPRDWLKATLEQSSLLEALAKELRRVFN